MRDMALANLRSRRRKLVTMATVVVGAFALLGALALTGTGWVRAVLPAAHVAYHPKDPELRALPLYFYPAIRKSPRGLVLFFGNDVGFWASHQRLAESMSAGGFDVVGFDVTAWLEALPKDNEIRARCLTAELPEIIRAARGELHDSRRPLVLMGHSSGAELALWAAAHVPLDALGGIIAMSPGARGHFLADHLSRPGKLYEPEEPGSFSVAATTAAVPRNVRIEIVRGSRDGYAYADADILAAGGSRASLIAVPLATHSMRSLLSETLLERIVARATVTIEKRRTRLASETPVTLAASPSDYASG